MLLARWFDSDLDILPQGCEKLHEALDRERAGAVAHQCGDVGLLNAEKLPRFGLGQPALLDQAKDLQCEPRFQEFLFGMGKTEIGEDIPAALF